MFTESEFNEAIAYLAKRNGLPLDTAGDWMALIGDTPEVAEDGRVIVRTDDGHELGRVWIGDDEG